MEDFLKDFYTVTIIRETLKAFKASVLEVVLLFSVILGLISLLVFVYVFQKKKKIAERKANSEELFQKGIKNKTLTVEEFNVLEKMVKVISEGEYRRHELVLQETVFDSAAGKLSKRRELSGETIASLRLKLLFPKASSNKTILTTAEIPNGKQVYIKARGSNSKEASIVDINYKGLILEVTKGESGLSKENWGEVTVTFTQKTGIYWFTSVVIGKKENLLTLEHSWVRKEKQRRNFFRKDIKKKVLLQTVQGGKTERYQTVLYNLGGGGAKIKNPGKGFSKGDGVTLYVPLSMETHQFKSVITRISGNGKFLHLEFRDIRESDRDKIISYLFHR